MVEAVRSFFLGNKSYGGEESGLLCVQGCLIQGCVMSPCLFNLYGYNGERSKWKNYGQRCCFEN